MSVIWMPMATWRKCVAADVVVTVIKETVVGGVVLLAGIVGTLAYPQVMAALSMLVLFLMLAWMTGYAIKLGMEAVRYE
jgi:hypothetical protein